METVRLHVKCTACGKFDKIIDLDINKYGYFTIPDAYCPECFCLMIQCIDGEEKQCQKK